MVPCWMRVERHCLVQRSRHCRLPTGYIVRRSHPPAAGTIFPSFRLALIDSAIPRQVFRKRLLMAFSRPSDIHERSMSRCLSQEWSSLLGRLRAASRIHVRYNTMVLAAGLWPASGPRLGWPLSPIQSCCSAWPRRPSCGRPMNLPSDSLRVAEPVPVVFVMSP
jgi:hypothetical protein